MILGLLAKRRVLATHLIKFKFYGVCNLSTSSSLFDKFSPKPSLRNIQVPKIVPSSRDHLVEFSSDLVDNTVWSVPTGLPSNIDLSIESSTGNGNLVEEENSDFDLIDELRVQKKLFYKLDKDSREYEEYSVNFHHKKTVKKKRKTELARQNGVKEERKRLDKANLDKPEREGKKSVKQNSKSRTMRAAQKSVKAQKSSLFLENEHLHAKCNGVGVRMASIEGKKVRKPTYNQLTDPYHLPFCLDIFITKGSVRACIVHRVTSKVVAVAHSISKDLKFDLTSRKDAKACASVGEILAQRALEDDIHNVVYTPRKGDKIEGKLQIVLQSIIKNGIDVKLKLKQKNLAKEKQTGSDEFRYAGPSYDCS